MSLPIIPCNGVLFYQWNGRSPKMEVGLTQHAKGGYGLTFGGKINVAAALATPMGHITSMIDHLYDEGEEELGARALHNAVPLSMLKHHAQLIDVSLVRVKDTDDDDIKVHVPAYYAYPVTPHEKLMLANLPETEERVGQIIWATLRWRGDLENGSQRAKNITLHHDSHDISWSVFKHSHEQECVLQTMAILAMQQRLWNDRRQAA